ncbi:nuclease-related domain-containing protein [Arthrobacter sp. L77]|uniref:nuclease-related domain-containing protein n=1 Tax=Arthrobacter sp. L77 TaxID=1496689 RepID=UPI00068C9FB5|nr:nuclease-related domain-containing protein [Arthrobacter sp. L77]
MLHFPSTNTAAHTPDPRDVTRLHQLLGHHVWAFSNCRVDAPGLPVAEVDWLFYNSLNGTFILSEWKRYPAAVLQVMDEGKPWTLVNGAAIPNPVEQVGRQLHAVRRVLRQDVSRKHFPSVDQQSLNLYPSVYSPQIDEATRRERLRYGAVHGSLEEVALMVERRAVTAPLLVSGGKARLELAETLTDLFRCSIGSAVRRKLDPPPPVRPDPGVRMAAIHRELAALHVELASLLETPEPQAVRDPVVARAVPPTPPVTNAVPSMPLSPASSSPASPSSPAPPSLGSKPGHLQQHVIKHVPLTKANAQHVRAAFLAALQDGRLRRSGVHIGMFGGLVGQRLKGGPTLASLAPGSLRKWCLAQAATAGVAASIDEVDPSIVRIGA